MLRISVDYKLKKSKYAIHNNKVLHCGRKDCIVCLFKARHLAAFIVSLDVSVIVSKVHTISNGVKKFNVEIG